MISRRKSVSQPIAAARVNAFLLLCARRNSSPAATAAGRNRLGKFPATVIQTRVEKAAVVVYGTSLAARDVNVCISIILRSNECHEPTTLTHTCGPFPSFVLILASKAPTVFSFERQFLRWRKFFFFARSCDYSAVLRH